MSARQRAHAPAATSRRSVAPSPSWSSETTALAVAVVAGGLFFWRAAADPFGLPRWTVLVLVSVFLLAHWAVVLWREGTLPALPRPVGYSLAAFLALGAVSVLVANDHAIAMLGVPFRQNGYASYLVYAVLFIAALQVRVDQWSRLATVAAAVVGIVSVYGVIQWTGHDPLSWPGAELSTVFSTLGQVNFAAGYVAVGLPFLLWAALERRHVVGVRAAAAVGAVLAAVFIVATESFQGIPAGAVGSLPVLLLAAHRFGMKPGTWRIIGAGALVAVLAVAVVPTTRHFVRENLDSGFQERLLLWDAAGNMVGDSPVIGKGFAGYSEAFPAARPAEHARLFNTSMADEPHSVPIEMAVDGGMLLLLAYLTFVGIVGWHLVTGLRRRPTLLLGAIGGGWLAYQVQSLVSFDFPAIASLHWVLAGAIVVLATDPARAVVRVPSPANRQLATGIGVGFTLVAAIWLTIPLRADLTAQQAQAETRRDAVGPAAEHFKRAAELAPWNATYWANLATTYTILGQTPDALAAGRKAIDRSPGSISYYLAEARLNASAGRQRDALAWFRRAMARDPHDSFVWFQAAQWARTNDPAAASRWYRKGLAITGTSAYLREAVDFERTVRRNEDGARREAEALLQRLPDDPNTLLIVGELRELTGDRPGALRAYRAALQLDPMDPRIKAGLERLRG